MNGIYIALLKKLQLHKEAKSVENARGNDSGIGENLRRMCRQSNPDKPVCTITRDNNTITQEVHTIM